MVSGPLPTRNTSDYNRADPPGIIALLSPAIFRQRGAQSEISWLSHLFQRRNKALKNARACVEQLSTFWNLVSVREVESNERLELIFQPEEEQAWHTRD